MPGERHIQIDQIGSGHPTLLAIASFWARSKGLQAIRAVKNTRSPSPTLREGPIADFPFVLAESVSLLCTAVDLREKPLLLGKIHNLRLASRKIQRRLLLPGQVFSFWRQVGPPWKLRGFKTGREVREGCVIPTRGGGICQLSGSLLEVALSLGFELIEKHGHTALPVDVPRDMRRDATVFWNYVDLRFRTQFPVLLESYLTDVALIVRVRGQRPRILRPVPPIARAQQPAVCDQRRVESCYLCDETACFRHRSKETTNRLPRTGSTAFLMDEYQPEFNAYIMQNRRSHDHLLMPFRSGRTQGDWSSEEFRRVKSFPMFRFRRTWMLRRAVSQGVTVAKAHFELAELLAKTYEKHIPYDVEHLCVAQTLLPYLWQAGILGGRSFDVLMYRFPVTLLERHLDAAARLYPESRTLNEFRCPPWFAEAEEEALRAARRIVTPHSQIANLFDKSLQLPWENQIQHAEKRHGTTHRDLIVFFGPTLARKGAYAVRDAVKKMGFSPVVVGSELEGPGFWKGVPVIRADLQNLVWDRVLMVLQPALFEYWPRQLLRAHTSGSHLVISPNCGIAEDRHAGIYHVPFGDVDALVSVTEALLTNGGTSVCVA
jgi:hypothetical protein